MKFASCKKFLKNPICLVLLLTSLLLAIEILYLLFYAKALDLSHIKQSQLFSLSNIYRSGLFYDFAFFIFGQFLIHLIFVSIVYFTYLGLFLRFNINENYKIVLFSIIFILFFTNVLLLNNFIFSRSFYSFKTSFLNDSNFGNIFILVYTLFSICIFAFALATIIIKYKVTSGITLSTLAIFYVFAYVNCKDINFDKNSHENFAQHNSNFATRPNIIFIGIDSLRLQDMAPIDKNTLLMPNLYHYAISSTIFGRAYTPLARTFPAWTSVLTGLYPVNHGAYYNLVSKKDVSLKKSLSRILKRHGYKTYFAMDDARFGNIDEDFGFDKVITPKMGLGDFILGDINDFPITNLFVNSKIGKFLFPYNYMNRAANRTYLPNTFVDEIKYSLDVEDKAPKFIAIHLCLPQWPYSFATSGAKNGQDLSIFGKRFFYRTALAMADMQFKEIMEYLYLTNLLDNSIVVLLSDHGESFNFKSDFYAYEKYDENGNIKGQFPFSKVVPMGHGSNILSGAENEVLLTIRDFRNKKPSGKVYFEPVSLIDIKPTIMDMLGINHENLDGISLKSFVEDKAKQSDKPRNIFIESGFTPVEIKSLKKVDGNISLDMSPIYKLEDNSKLISLKKDNVKNLLKYKQLGLLRGKWLFAKWNNDEVIVDIIKKIWTNDFNSKLAKEAPVNDMRKTMYEHFKVYLNS